MSELLTNGNNKVKAAQAAWKCTGEESARTMANRALKNESISFLVESYFGRDPESLQFTRDEALNFAAKRARGTEPKIALDYFKIIVAMNGWLMKAAEPPTPPAPPPPAIPDDSNDPFIA